MDPPRVLLAEDSPSLLVLYRTWVELDGFEAVCAADGWQALRAVEQLGLPDVALLDVRMPFVDGLQLCRRLHRLDPGLPVVFVTADEETVPAARAVGAAAVLLKPCSHGQVEAALRHALHSRYGPTTSTAA